MDFSPLEQLTEAEIIAELKLRRKYVIGSRGHNDYQMYLRRLRNKHVFLEEKVFFVRNTSSTLYFFVSFDQNQN